MDFRLDFQEHWKSLLKKVNKTVALLGKFQNILPRSTLVSICKCFVKTHLNYGDIIYDQAFNNSFHQKIESLQYNAALAVTGIKNQVWNPFRKDFSIETYVSFLRYIKTSTRHFLSNPIIKLSI